MDGSMDMVPTRAQHIRHKDLGYTGSDNYRHDLLHMIRDHHFL